jgi:hypothetical protein
MVRDPETMIQRTGVIDDAINTMSQGRANVRRLMDEEMAFRYTREVNEQN